MGDLTSVVNFTKALMKIDIEGFENRAMRFANRLFDNVFIPYIMMEWNTMKAKRPQEIVPMLRWFRKRDYEARKLTSEVESTVLLDYKKWQSWSYDVIFRHKSVNA